MRAEGGQRSEPGPREAGFRLTRRGPG